MFAPSADFAEVEGEVVVFAVDLLYVALDYGDSPAQGELVVGEHAEHALVPEVLSLCWLFVEAFLVGEG